MGTKIDYQNDLLNAVRKDNIPVKVFLSNGFQLKGTVTAFDNYVVFLENDGKQQMLYKHAITTVEPFKSVKLDFSRHAGNADESK